MCDMRFAGNQQTGHSMEGFFPIGCNDTCRLIGNICNSMDEARLDEIFALADRKHWRKTDKAVVFGYHPGGGFDFIFARDLERLMKPEGTWMRGNLSGSRLHIAYDEDNSVEVYGTVLACGTVYFYATDENGNYRDIHPEELPVLFDFIVNNYGKIIFHGDLIEAIAV